MWHPTWFFGACPPNGAASGCFEAERVLGGAHQLGKQSVTVLGKRRELFAIDRHARLLEPVHQLAVGDAMLARQRVDSLDPQGAKYPLLLLAVAVGVGQPLLEGTASLTIQLAPPDETR